MAVASPDHLALLFHYTLVRAALEDDYRARELGAIHLLKYAYLADVAWAARHDGQTFSGTEWRFHHFGPWSTAAYERIDTFASSIGAAAKKVPSKFADDAIRYALTQDLETMRDRLESALPLGVAGAISHAVHEHGSDTRSLLRVVYLTKPMLAAKPGDILNFSTAIRPATQAVGNVSSSRPSNSKAWAARVAATRAEIAARLTAGPRGRVAPSPAPRFDDVFFEGMSQLETASATPLTSLDGTVEFDESVWTSEQRREDDLP